MTPDDTSHAVARFPSSCGRCRGWVCARGRQTTKDDARRYKNQKHKMHGGHVSTHFPHLTRIPDLSHAHLFGFDQTSLFTLPTHPSSEPLPHTPSPPQMTGDAPTATAVFVTTPADAADADAMVTENEARQKQEKQSPSLVNFLLVSPTPPVHIHTPDSSARPRRLCSRRRRM